MLEFFVYENWTINKAIVHRGECSFCNRGRGIHLGSGGKNSQWHGPFNEAPQALFFAKRLNRSRTDSCKFCAP
jgi:hypothetical protein